MIQCRFCGITVEQIDPSLLQEHHIIPKACDGTDEDGRLYLCKKCHDIHHGQLLKVIWSFIVDKEKAKRAIKDYTIKKRKF